MARYQTWTALCLLTFLFVNHPFSALAQADDLQGGASWKAPSSAQVKKKIDLWLKKHKLTVKVRKQIDRLWLIPSEGGTSDGAAINLNRLMKTIELAIPESKNLIHFCRGEHQKGKLVSFKLLTDPQTDPLVQNHLHLLFGRWLCKQGLIDEAYFELQTLKPADVIDPATLLFYQAVIHHQTLNKKECLKTIDLLLENGQHLPKRYHQMALLMKRDIAGLKTDSLDEIARLMKDVYRRLDLGRAGKKVRTKQDDIIAKLDKMIKKAENQKKQQQQQMMQGNGQSQGGNNPSSPMQDSMQTQTKGDGKVDQTKKIGNKKGWGNLPPKKRQAIVQRISNEFPSHYRELIEKYFTPTRSKKQAP